MKKEIYLYNNGIKCFKNTIFDVALARYSRFVNLHEPFEETVFEQIIINSRIDTFIDLGSAWGYYSIKAKLLNQKIKVTAFDCDKVMVRNGFKNALLNQISDIDFRHCKIPIDTTLCDILFEIGKIDLIKIDIQGDATVALKSANDRIFNIQNLIIGTHGTEHKECLDFLLGHGFKIKLNLFSALC